MDINGYLFRVGYTICKNKIVNDKISEEEKATKILFNSKNKLFTFEYFRISKKVYCNYYVCEERYITLNTKSTKSIRKSIRIKKWRLTISIISISLFNYNCIYNNFILILFYLF